MRALNHIAYSHRRNGRTVALIRPTSAFETMTMHGNRWLRDTEKLPRVDLVHAFSGGSLVMWHLRDRIDANAAVVFDSGPVLPSAKILTASIAHVTGIPAHPHLAYAIQQVWNATGYEGIYGPSDTATLRILYKRFVSDLVSTRPSLIIRGQTDPMLDDPDANDAILACGIETRLFDSRHIMHLRTHPSAYEASLRAFFHKNDICPW
jgi:hypothetical protein